ncbi:MAG: GIY-YIG nuclease family protein [Candidatus Omnitrophota bacterium]
MQARLRVASHKVFIVMWYVYVLISKRSRYKYIGSTNNLNRRVIEHNDGLCTATKPYGPFELAAYVAVRDKDTAIGLEQYLKTASGAAFINKRIL